MLRVVDSGRESLTPLSSHHIGKEGQRKSSCHVGASFVMEILSKRRFWEVGIGKESLRPGNFCGCGAVLEGYRLWKGSVLDSNSHS